MDRQTQKKVWLGTTAWAFDTWVGSFYPPKTKSGDYLTEYARRFPAVEVDSTFYAIPRESAVAGWARKTPDSFLLCPKFPQLITHEKRLTDAELETEVFLHTMRLLGPKLGPLVLQFDYTFHADQQDNLLAYLDALPNDLRYGVEVRHRGWLKEPFYAALRERNVALVMSDLYYMPRITVQTADFAYIRLLGDRRKIPGDMGELVQDRGEDLAWWRDQVVALREEGAEVFVFINNKYEGNSPMTVRRMAALLGENLPEQTQAEGEAQGEMKGLFGDEGD